MGSSPSQSTLVIATHNPRKKFYALLGIIVLITATYLYSTWDSLKEISSNRVTIRDLKEQVLSLEESKQTLLVAKSKLENEKRLAKISEDALVDSIKTKQAELYDLKKEIALYKGIMAASDNNPVLDIAEFQLNPTLKGKRYGFKVTLSNQDNKHRYVSGALNGELKGVNASGEAQSITLNDLVALKKPLNYRFRYFQVLSGELVLPEGFKPESIKFHVVNKQGGSIADKVYKWTVEDDQDV